MAPIPPTTNTGTPTARSTTRLTFPSNRSSVGAVTGTICRRPMRRRSCSTCWRWRCCSCWVGGCAGRGWGSRWPTPGCPTRSRCLPWRAIPTTRLWRCSSWRPCWWPPRRPRGACSRRWQASRSSRRSRSRRCCGRTVAAGFPLAPGRALALFALAFAATVAVVSIPALTHDSLHTIYERTLAYQSNRESPFSIWGLYGEPTHPWRLAGVVQGARSRAGPVGGDPAAPPRPGRPGGDRRRRARGRAARDRPLVLPVHTLVLRPGDAGPAGSGQLAGAGAPRAGTGGRAIRICSIESARNGLEARTSTPISQGSSLEVSKRTGICVTSASTACSRLTPITPPRGPVMPTSVM